MESGLKQKLDQIPVENDIMENSLHSMWENNLIRKWYHGKWSKLNWSSWTVFLGEKK